MPAALSRYQHELTTDYDNGQPELFSLVFGTENTGYLTTTYPVLEGDEGAVGDVQRYRGDGVSFGEDYQGSKRATFEIAVLTDKAQVPEFANHDAVERFEAVWRDERVRERSTKYAVLRSHMSGRVRRTYGRPRRFADTPGVTTRRGHTQIVCDFLSSDGNWYDDVEQVVSTVANRGGIDGMLEASTQNSAGRWVFTTLPGPGTSSGGQRPPDGYLPTTATDVLSPTGFTVGGTRPTWPVATFHASGGSSVLNPMVRIGGLVIKLADNIAAGKSVTVDTRPWSRQVVGSDGANHAGRLTADTPALRNCKMYPGAYSLIYTATDPTGGSYCELSFRNAYSRW